MHSRALRQCWRRLEREVEELGQRLRNRSSGLMHTIEFDDRTSQERKATRRNQLLQRSQIDELDMLCTGKNNARARLLDLLEHHPEDEVRVGRDGPIRRSPESFRSIGLDTISLQRKIRNIDVTYIIRGDVQECMLTQGQLGHALRQTQISARFDKISDVVYLDPIL